MIEAFQKYGHGAGETPSSDFDFAESALKSPILMNGTSSKITFCTSAHSATRLAGSDSALKASTALARAGVSQLPGALVDIMPMRAGSGRKGLWVM